MLLARVALTVPVKGETGVSARQQLLNISLPAERLLTFSHITAEHGLVDERVTSLLQDRTGFMWFGTNNGLTALMGMIWLSIVTRIATQPL